jgi:hypothetical protein
LLARFEAEGEAFLSRIDTADETRAHHFEPETKREQDKEWYRQDIHTLVSRWRKVVEVDGDFVEK